MPPEKKRKQLETRKQIWIIAYEQTSTTITPAMLQQHKILPLECHTAVWRGLKYTLIHCERANRISKAFIASVTEKLSKNHGIVLEGHASGHNLLSSTDSSKNEELTTHPGFVGILKLFKQKSADLQLWAGEGRTAHEDVAAMKKSVIYKQLRIERGPQQKIAELSSDLAEKDQKIADISADKDQKITELSSQLAVKERRISELSSQLAAKDQKISELSSKQLNAPSENSQQNEPQSKYDALRDEIVDDIKSYAAFRDFRSRLASEKKAQ